MIEYAIFAVVTIHLLIWLYAFRAYKTSTEAALNDQYKKIAEMKDRQKSWVEQSIVMLERLTSMDNAVAAKRAFWAVYLSNDWSAYAQYITAAATEAMAKHPNRKKSFFKPAYELSDLKEIAGLPTDVKKIDVPLAKALKELGWTKSQDRSGGKRKNLWHVPLVDQ